MKLTARDIQRQINWKLPNSADRSPIPQETEPSHFPMSALQPPPARRAPIPTVEQEWPWLRYVYGLGFLLAIVFSALADYFS
jgi:hypothetical protein